MTGEVAPSWKRLIGQLAATAILLGVFGTVGIVASGDARRAAPPILLTLLVLFVVIVPITIYRTPGLTLVPSRNHGATEHTSPTGTGNQSRRKRWSAKSAHPQRGDAATDLEILNMMITPEFAAAHPEASIDSSDLLSASMLGYDGFVGSLRAYATVLLLWAIQAFPAYLVWREASRLGRGIALTLFLLFVTAEILVSSAIWSKWLGKRAARFGESYLSKLGLRVVSTPTALVLGGRAGGGDVRLVGPQEMAGVWCGRTVASSCEITGQLIRGASATITTSIDGPVTLLHRTGGLDGWTGSPPVPRLDEFLRQLGTGVGHVEVTAGPDGVRITRAVENWSRATKVRSPREQQAIASGLSKESAHFQALRDVYLAEQICTLTG